MVFFFYFFYYLFFSKQLLSIKKRTYCAILPFLLSRQLWQLGMHRYRSLCETTMLVPFFFISVLSRFTVSFSVYKQKKNILSILLEAESGVAHRLRKSTVRSGRREEKKKKKKYIIPFLLFSLSPKWCVERWHSPRKQSLENRLVEL